MSALFEHTVQFYENDANLCSIVTDYLADGLRSGEPVVAITSASHRQLILGGLRERGFHPSNSRMEFLDAHETLRTFMEGALPDAQRFDRSVGSVIRKFGIGTRVRAFGEMVDVLWRDGNPYGAVRLEELWNELASRHDFSLLCAYQIGGFYKTANGHLCDEIVHVHSLQNELAHRSELESALRRSLDSNAFLLEASTVLNQSLDYESRLRALADLVVPRLADYCIIDILREDETSDRLTRGHEAPELVSDRMAVPMKFGDRVLGEITFMAESTRRFSDGDRTLANELAQRAAIAVENARLYRLAQEANRTKDEFLATLSHELRTPLTAILGWARMLSLGGLDSDTVRTAIETIERSARTQATLIDDLLDLSRVVTGKLALNTELVDVGSVVGNAAQTLRLAAQAKGVALDIDATSERVVVTGDPTRLQQIIWNLLSNAVKFSEAGRRVSLSLEQDDRHAKIVVRDQGRGIRKEFLPHVFEPFRQADGASTRKHGGLGLGLAIVKYLTELHGGTVTARSDGEGHGAAFTVLLPLAGRVMEASAKTESEVVDLRGKSILLVDDDEATRDLVVAMLRRCGADVYALESVRHAREFLATKRPDVVVTDIAMPEQDGYALLEHILAGGDGLPVIALTASGSALAESQLTKRGFTGWIRKPIDPFDFARVISLTVTPAAARIQLG